MSKGPIFEAVRVLAASGQKLARLPDLEGVAEVKCNRCGHTMPVVLDTYLRFTPAERGCIKGCGQ